MQKLNGWRILLLLLALVYFFLSASSTVTLLYFSVVCFNPSQKYSLTASLLFTDLSCMQQQGKGSREDSEEGRTVKEEKKRKQTSVNEGNTQHTISSLLLTMTEAR